MFKKIEKKQLPNLITIGRGLAVLLIIFFFFRDWSTKYVFIFWIFLAASLSDYADGYLARKWQVVSDFGKIFDPLFDKVLTLTMYIILFNYPGMPQAVFIWLFLREIIVDGLKNYMLSKGVVTAAITSAKIKTVLQVIMIYLALIYIIYPDIDWLLTYATIFGWLAVFLAYWSGGIYVRKFLAFYKTKQA